MIKFKIIYYTVGCGPRMTYFNPRATFRLLSTGTTHSAVVPVLHISALVLVLHILALQIFFPVFPIKFELLTIISIYIIDKIRTLIHL